MAGRMSALKTRVLDFFGRKQSTLPESNQDRPGKDEIPMASYAESHSLYVFDQFQVAVDRISIIRDVQELCKNDLRFAMTNKRVAADAARGGFKVVVQGSEEHRKLLKRRGKSLNRLTAGSNIAQQVIDDFLKRTKLSAKAENYLRALPRDGDLFLNPIVDLSAGLVLDIRRAPALTIKRNSDEFGEFPDIERAFSQIDPRTQINTLMEIGPPSVSRTDFALYQMNHVRWLMEETLPYGTSHYASARKTHKILERMEKAAAIRREFRSVLKFNHKMPDDAKEQDVIQYKRDVGLIDKNGRPTRNAHLLSDFVGTAEVKSLQGDANLSEMDDIKYFDDLLWLNLGIPKTIVTGGKEINRDILKVQYPAYLKTLNDLTDTLEYGDAGYFSGLRDLIDLQLLLDGINPDAVEYDIVWSQKTAETENEIVDRVQIALGANGGEKLITRQKAIQVIAESYDIEDPVEMAKLVEEEEARKAAQVGQIQQAAAAHTVRIPGTSKLNAVGNQAAEKRDNQPVVDVVLEDRTEFQTIEDKAKETVLRFFRSIYKKMTEYYGAITDSVILDFSADEILSILDDAWDENESTYRVGIVKNMTEAGLLGADRAVQLVMDFNQGKSKDPAADHEMSLKMRIVRDDIYDDLLNESSTRIVGIKSTTQAMLRDTLAEGFEDNLGWKELMKQIQPIIVDPVRAEMIARTELSWAYTRMQKRIYQDAGFTKVEWHAVLDQRTCPVCRSRNGDVYSMDDHPDMPAHPRCRCSFLPAE
ncbi:portal protein [Aneurinibacillus terranovensis]|uniref:portal protein n=1 Tax=Aneurinibacillus terranovensis TaxID=278991 RepID=UPI000415337C|nr:portal protein [Aneurinibacillus terranovensis]